MKRGIGTGSMANVGRWLADFPAAGETERDRERQRGASPLRSRIARPESSSAVALLPLHSPPLGWEEKEGGKEILSFFLFFPFLRRNFFFIGSSARWEFGMNDLKTTSFFRSSGYSPCLPRRISCSCLFPAVSSDNISETDRIRPAIVRFLFSLKFVFFLLPTQIEIVYIISSDSPCSCSLLEIETKKCNFLG